MIREYNTRSLLLGLPGLVAQFAGNLMVLFRPELAGLGMGLLILGTALLMGGLAFYAVAKGQHPAWALMGLLSLLGFIVLGLLPDRSVETQPARTPPSPRRSPRPSEHDSAAPRDSGASGHDFNAVGVCTRCGCGRSAAHLPCTS